MIPEEHITPRMIHLQEIVDSLGGPDALAKPTPEDLQLMGHYIQLFNFIELNLRRAIEVFARAGLLEPSVANKHHKLPSGELVPRMKAVVETMDPATEDIHDSLGKLDEIELRRSFRNIVAHWAARRIPNEDALYFMSKDGRDAKQISGEDKIERDYVRTAIADMADMRGLAQHMNTYELWIAKKAWAWYLRYIECREPTRFGRR